MRRLIAALALTIFVLFPHNSYARDWSKAVAKVTASTIQVTIIHEDEDSGEAVRGYCSAFSIDGDGTFMTAAHCTEGSEAGPSAGVYSSTVEFVDPDRDIAVIHFDAKAMRRPALSPHDGSVLAGSEYGALGFAYGLPSPLFKAGNIANSDIMIENGIAQTFIDEDAVGGMSGGPTFDKDGKIVAVITEGNGHFGKASSLVEILKVTSAYWQHKPAKTLASSVVSDSLSTDTTSLEPSSSLQPIVP